MQEEHIVKDLFILTTKLKRLLDKKHLSNGIYAGKARILIFLYRRGDEKTYQKDIEKAFQIRGGTVTGMIDSLVSGEYLKRVDSESDRRKKKIVLTELGHSSAVTAIETFENMENQIYSLLLPSEKETIKNVINKINNYVDSEELT